MAEGLWRPTATQVSRRSRSKSKSVLRLNRASMRSESTSRGRRFFMHEHGCRLNPIRRENRSALCEESPTNFPGAILIVLVFRTAPWKRPSSGGRGSLGHYQIILR